MIGSHYDWVNNRLRGPDGFSSKITNSSESESKIQRKRKRKTELMRSGGISDEDARNRPFSFTLVVNNPNESAS